MAAAACVLLVAAGVPAAAAGAPDAARGDSVSASFASNTASAPGANATAVDGPYVHVRFTITQHPDPGVVSVRITADPPDNVNKLKLTIDEDVTVKGASGFEHTGDRVWTWNDDQTTVDEPTITGAYAANQSSRTFDGYNYVDTNDWALVETPYVYAHWWYTSDPPPSYKQTASVGTDTSGYGGSSMVFVGEHATYNATRSGQSFTLVVPRAARSPPNPERVFETLAFASNRLDVGARDDGVNVFVAPEPIRDGGREENSDSSPDSPQRDDIWVSADQSGTSSVYFHEYAHTRQDFQAADRMAWFREASASYYEALLSLHAGHWTYREFRDDVTTDEYADAVLTDPGHSQEADYEKGARVLAALDAKIRRATGGDRTLEDVWRRVNAHEGKLSYADFKRIVERVAGRSMGDWLDRYLTTQAVPDVPNDKSLFAATDPDADADGDGVPKSREFDAGTDPFAVDTDEDGLDDPVELDGPTNATNADTDGDGLVDGRERELGTDPTVADTDGDGIKDARERSLNTSPTAADSDSDGLSDRVEQSLGTDPTAEDTDEDGLVDGRERELGTDPTVADTDGDGIEDGAERERGTDPLDAASPTETTTTTATGDSNAGEATDDAGGESNGESGGGSPGFTAVGALAALAAAALIARRR